MEILIRGGQLILSLSILILLHEFGHYIAARMFSTRVEKFYLFFNPWFEIFKFKKGDTEYGLGWLPLGGYVKISGMIDESMDKEQLKQPPQPYEFRSKPAWQRLIIMLGGIIMNVVLGFTIYWFVLYGFGESYFKNSDISYGIMVDALGKEMGFQNGDFVVAVNGKPADRFNRIASDLVLSGGGTITVNRNDELIDVPVSKLMIRKVLESKQISFISARIPFIVDSVLPGLSASLTSELQKGDYIIQVNGNPAAYYDEVKDQFMSNKGKMMQVTILRNHQLINTKLYCPTSATIGVSLISPLKIFTVTDQRYGIVAALPAGINKAYEALVINLKQFKLIFSKDIQGYKHVGGFLTIASAFSATEWDWQSFWTFTAFLSIVLAFMNLLPIPALDGGHVMFTLYEMITRRKPADKFLEYAQVVGMILLFALLIFANGNDIFKLFQ